MTAPFWRNRALAIFAALGALSGVVGALTWPLSVVPAVIYGIPSVLSVVGAVVYGTPTRETISLSPGIAFAVALAVAIALTVTRRIVPIAAMMAATMLGWWITVEIAAIPVMMDLNAAAVFAYWFACGVLGASIVGFTGALVGLYDRSLTNLVAIGGIGGLLALVLIVPGQTHYWFLLILWQTGVGAALGHAVASASRSTAPIGEVRAVAA